MKRGVNEKAGHGFRAGLVSVIIPTYNYAAFVGSALESAIGQRSCDVEIIVVDDGSTDNTREVLSPYKNKINYVYQENAGLTEARNTGIKNSSGEFILFLDADDILGSDAIASQLNFLRSHSGADVVVCRNRFFNHVTGAKKPSVTGKWRLFESDLAVHLCYCNIAPPHAFLFRRKVISQTGWFDPREQTCGDYDFWLRAAMLGFVPHYNPKGLVYYRRHPQSMSADLKNQYAHDAILHKRLTALLDQYPQYPKGRRLEGLLAFTAGVLQTVSRLSEYKADRNAELVPLAVERSEDANRIAGIDRSGWNALTRLYVLKIIAGLAHPCFRNSGTKAKIESNLRQIVSKVKGPSSKLFLLKDAMNSIGPRSKQNVTEKRELVRTFLKYLRNNAIKLFSKK